MTPETTDLDPRISRFARDSAPEMSAEQVAPILNVNRMSVYRLCAGPAPLLSAVVLATKTNGEDKRPMKRWCITQAALLRYIVHTTTGDRTLLLRAIAQQCPKWLKHAREWALELPAAATAEPSAPDWLTPPAPRARAARAAPADPFAKHPDLFTPTTPVV